MQEACGTGCFRGNVCCRNVKGISGVGTLLLLEQRCSGVRLVASCPLAWGSAEPEHCFVSSSARSSDVKFSVISGMPVLVDGHEQKVFITGEHQSSVKV